MQFIDAGSARANDYRFKTEIGQALHPYLLTPDRKFDDAGRYKIGLVMDPDEIRAAREAFTAMYRKAYPDQPGEPHMPFKIDDGRPYLVAKSTYQPKLMTPDRKEITAPVMVASGHRVRVIGRARPYRSAFASGVTLYLSQVEIHEDVATLDTYRPAQPIAAEGAFKADRRSTADTKRSAATEDEDLGIPF